MPDFKRIDDLPPGLRAVFKANAQAMQHFYSLSPKERQDVLDSICEVNEQLDRLY